MEVSENNLRLAAFLAAEGALQPDPLETPTRFKITSPLVGSLIRRRVIPQIYPNAPLTPIPKNQDGSLNMLEVVKEVVNHM